MLRPIRLLAALLLVTFPLQAQPPSEDSLGRGSDSAAASRATAVHELDAGAHLRLRVAGGRTLTARLMRVDDSSLVVRPDPDRVARWMLGERLASRGIAAESVERRAIERLELGEYPPWRRSATITAAVAGAVVGATAGAASASDCTPAFSYCLNPTVLGTMGGLLGLGVGALIGRDVVGAKQWREIRP